jgi:hypothetical protein
MLNCKLYLHTYTEDEEEVIGRSQKCFILLNVLTSSKIRKATSQQPFETVVNYNKNGEIYICLIKGFLYLILKASCPILLLLKSIKKPLVEKGLYI